MEIRIQGVSKHYISEGKTIKALDNVDLTIPANQIFTLLGPSGCGKTTLLRCIVGLESPDEGEIAIGDEVVWSRDKGIFVPTERRGLGMVFQTYAIWPHMNVFDNVAYPLQTRGTPMLSAGRSRRPSSSCSWRDLKNARPPNSREGSSSVWLWPGRWWPNPRSSSSTSP